MGAQSHVAVSFDVPEYTAQVDAIGTIRLLDAVKDLKNKPRFYQASTLNYLEGYPETAPQSEKTFFILNLPMVQLKFMHIGLLLITEKHMTFTHAMESYLIMSHLEEEKLCNKKNHKSSKN